jgi:hypothetical protein
MVNSATRRRIRAREAHLEGELMKKAHIIAAAFAALLVAGPATAQWPPPPPPFVANPQLTPPPGTPSALPQVSARKQMRAEKQKARAERRTNRQQRANACHREADSQGLSGRERRRFVKRCRRG